MKQIKVNIDLAIYDKYKEYNENRMERVSGRV